MVEYKQYEGFTFFAIPKPLKSHSTLFLATPIEVFTFLVKCVAGIGIRSGPRVLGMTLNEMPSYG